MKLMNLLTGIGLGAGIMYLWDPERGNRRRALIRDQAVSFKNQTDESLQKATEDLRNRTRGVLAETMGRLSNEESSDWLINERVRAELGRSGYHTGGLQIECNDGVVKLSGPILADELDAIIRRVGHIRGVREVINEMDVHQEPGNIPALQGVSYTPQAGNWSPSMRLLSGVGGGTLALYGTMRKGFLGTLMQFAGLGLAARGVTNLDLKSLIGMGKRKDAILVNKAININAPVEELYRFWSNFENFPRFMQHVKEVKNLGNGRSHWKVAGPAGTTVEWDAITTRQIPDQMISWESVAGSDVQSQGTVQFRRNPDGGTHINVRMGYTPPAGALGHVVATLMGSNPRQEMNDDLGRLKSLFEEGKTTVEGRKLSGEDLASAASA